LAELVGSSPETLMRFYQHVTRELHRQTVEKIPDLLDPKPIDDANVVRLDFARKKKIKKESGIQCMPKIKGPAFPQALYLLVGGARFELATSTV
jgi:hypothetical protein